MIIGYKLKFKKIGAMHHVTDMATEEDAQRFYDNIPEYFNTLVANNKGLTGAIFIIGGKNYAYGSCIGITGYSNLIPYVTETTPKSRISDVPTEELIMELINRGYTVSKTNFIEQS